MKIDIDATRPPASATAQVATVFLSKWVNEKYPPWADLLTAHELARLTRRHRWLLSALALIGRFPKKQRFHGRAIAWLRSDVVRDRKSVV